MKKTIFFTPIKNKTEQVKLAEFYLNTVCAKMKKKADVFIIVFNELKFVPVREKIDICTNGEVVFYNPKIIIRFAKAKRLHMVEQTLFHIFFHGILGHFEQTNWKKKKLSWAVQDIQVYRYMKMLYKESLEKQETIDTFDEFEHDILDEFLSPEELMEENFFSREKLRNEELLKQETEEILKNYLCDELYYKGIQNKAFQKKIFKIGKNCWYENHAVWDYKEEQKLGESAEQEKSKKQTWKKARELLFGVSEVKEERKSDMQKTHKESIEKLINKINSVTYGNESASLENEVEYCYESSNSYKELLEKITSLSEVVYEEQELDKTLYTYGLSMYGDVPLVEPEEISEKHTLHTIVVAVDTSGSCTHRAKKFFREVVAVFNEIKKCGHLKHVCYLECDTAITNKKNCESIEEFIEFGTRHTFLGGGGTDFIPVFKHTDSLVEQGEEVDALIYITDGKGSFPQYEERPPYKVILLLDVDEDEECVYIPEWAEVIWLDESKYD